MHCRSNNKARHDDAFNARVLVVALNMTAQSRSHERNGLLTRLAQGRDISGFSAYAQ